MFEKLKSKWKVNGSQLFLILCTFAVTGTLTAYISRTLPGWIGMDSETAWIWKALLRLGVLFFGYQVIILVVSVFFGQFRFFWNYEKKILRWMGILKKQSPEPTKDLESTKKDGIKNETWQRKESIKGGLAN